MGNIKQSHESYYSSSITSFTKTDVTQATKSIHFPLLGNVTEVSEQWYSIKVNIITKTERKFEYCVGQNSYVNISENHIGLGFFMKSDILNNLNASLPYKLPSLSKINNNLKVDYWYM